MFVLTKVDLAEKNLAHPDRIQKILAGLLGIDPSNIRITNIVRENSVGRKKRQTEESSSNGTITGVEFEIGPPPIDDLVEFFPHTS